MKPSLASRTCEDGVCDTGIILDYGYRDERLLFNVVLRKSEDRSSVVGMHIRIIPEPFIAANEFRLANKGLPQYTVLMLAMLFPAFSVYALVVCIYSRRGIRKWLWAFFILIGISKVGVNWTTGQLDFRFISVQVLSAAAFQQPYGPWIISVSVPLGAILFFMLTCPHFPHGNLT